MARAKKKERLMKCFYQARIDHVIDYVQAHLSEALDVSKLAQLAFFSEYHFNRLFKDRTGESLYQFIRRLRLENAANLLCSDAKPITQVALECGFSNSSSFAKAFKQHFGYNASQWKAELSTHFRKASFPISRNGLCSNQSVFLEQLEPITVAYVRNIGNYIADAELFGHLYEKLLGWAIPRGFLCDETYNIYHDNPNITASTQLRVMVALEVPDVTLSAGDIGITRLNGGKYAVRRFYLKDDEYSSAWAWMTTEWLSQSGYAFDVERESIERCLGEYNYNGCVFYRVDICIPIKALG